MKNYDLIRDALIKTELSSVHISIDDSLECSFVNSKIGKEFYLPLEAVIPISKSGEQMEFLGQINFSQIPMLLGYPDEGILQFFLDTNEETIEEMNDSELSKDRKFKVIFYPKVQPELQQVIHSHVVNYEGSWDMKRPVGKMIFTPFYEIATLSFSEDRIISCYGTENIISELSTDLFCQAGCDLSNCSDTDEFLYLFGNWGFKVGGYPAIRQEDIRIKSKKLSEYSVLLFQYDTTTNEELEADTFSFFIKPQDLKRKSFDDILLCWHNCY